MQQIYLEKLGKLKLHKADMFHEKKRVVMKFYQCFHDPNAVHGTPNVDFIFHQRTKKNCLGLK